MLLSKERQQKPDGMRSNGREVDLNRRGSGLEPATVHLDNLQCDHNQTPMNVITSFKNELATQTCIHFI